MISDRRKQAIIEMAKRGTPEEQKIAESIIDNLNISIEDEEISKIEFTYRSNHEKTILFQIWVMVVNDISVSYYSSPEKKKSIFFEITKNQKTEIDLFYSIYKRELKEELDITVRAFIQKNRLFAQCEIDNPSGTKEDFEKTRRILNRANTIDKTHIRKQIGGTNA